MNEVERQGDQKQIVRDITFQAARAIESGRPLFLIVYYQHETLKLSFLQTLAQALLAAGLGSKTFDPVLRSDHGAGRLYPLLADAAASRCLALITGIPRAAVASGQAASDLADSFLDYLNLHRDRIERDRLRLVLFVHSSEAERFMAGAGDLWDFRHHTYWLEGMPLTDRVILWSSKTTTTTTLTAQDEETIASHIESARALIEQTPEPAEKATLFLDLSRWLTRHHCPASGVEAALAGLKLLDATTSFLRAKLEHALNHALHKDRNTHDALIHYERSLANYREIGDRASEGSTLNDISMIYQAWGRYSEALQALEQSLAIYREIGNRAGEGGALSSISMIYQAWGRYAEALQVSEQSLAIYREIGDRAGEGGALSSIAMIYQARGRYGEALQLLEQSLSIRRIVGNRAGEGATLNNISQIYQAWGRYDEALQVLEQSLAIYREIGDRAGEGATLNDISGINKARGRNSNALQALKQSLAIYREIGDRAGEGATLNNIALIYQAWGRYNGAMQAQEESLAICREMDDLAGEGVICWNMALEYKRRGDLARAVEFASRTVDIEEELHHPDAQKSREFLRLLEQGLSSRDSS